MTISPLNTALSRISKALERLEAAAGKLEDSAHPADQQLLAKHEALRHEVQAVLGALDGMIVQAAAAQGGGQG